MERRIDRLEKYMIIKKLNDNQVTKDCDLSVGLLNQAKRGKSDLGSKAIDKILSKYQDLSRVWLLTGEGSMLSQPATSSPRSPVPVYDIDVTCGLSETRTYSDMPLEGYIDIPSISRDAIVVKTHGDSMLPTVHDGEYVAIRRIDT